MTRKTKSDEMRSRYDFSDGVRGKYAARYAQATNVLSPDVSERLPDAVATNEARRTLVPRSTKMVRSKAAAKGRAK
jgi:hypothetical protein